MDSGNNFQVSKKLIYSTFVAGQNARRTSMQVLKSSWRFCTEFLRYISQIPVQTTLYKTKDCDFCQVELFELLWKLTESPLCKF